MKKCILSLMLAFCLMISSAMIAQANALTIELTENSTQLDIYPDRYVFNGGGEVSYSGPYILTGNMTEEVNFHSGSSGEQVYDVVFQDLTVIANQDDRASAVKLVNKDNGTVTLNLITKGTSFIQGSQNHPAIQFEDNNAAVHSGRVHLTMEEGSTLRLKRAYTSDGAIDMDISFASGIEVTAKDAGKCTFYTDNTKRNYALSLPLDHLSASCDDGIHHTITCPKCGTKILEEEQAKHAWDAGTDAGVTGVAAIKYTCIFCGLKRFTAENHITLQMLDAYNDGWDGASLAVYTDGEKADTLSPKSEESDLAFVPYNDSTYYEFVWNKGPQYDEECGLVVTLPKTKDAVLFHLTSEKFFDTVENGERILVIGNNADYNRAEDVLDQILTIDLSIYTEESVSALQHAIAALKALDPNLPSYKQEEIDLMVEAVEKALAALVLNPELVTVVQTGDTQNPALWFGLLLFSLTASVLISKKYKSASR